MMIKENCSKIFKKGDELRGEVQNRIAGYMAGAFGLIAGLAWNDAVKSLIEYFFPQTGNGLLAKFIYALLITLVVVIVTVYLVKFLEGKKQDEQSAECEK